MRIAINDISFFKGFERIDEARKALIQFADVALQLMDARVSNVNASVDIVNSSNVHKALELAPQYSLIEALNDLKSAIGEQYLRVLQILTMRGEEEDENAGVFCLFGYQSKHCARHKEDFLLSIVSDEKFAKKKVEGTLSDGETCSIRNIADEGHIFFYWEELGFRLYENNPKHGKQEYIRAGGEKVSIAPESDELGQALLNNAIIYKGKLFSVDTERNNRIFEFRYSYANKYHGFLQDNLTEEDRKRIVAAMR